VDHAGLREIQKAGERAAQLVQQLLLFGRKVEIARRPVDINQEVEQARRILERTIPKMIRIEVLLDGALKAVKADPVQIEQVLLNLGGNSADAMPDGGLLVIETRNLTIDAENAHQHEGVPKGGYVLIKVSDTGRGMEPWVVQHIFDPFFTTKGVGKGTGLGLSSVYGIVKGHGGYITCVSAPEKGTIFNVYLPASEAHVQPVVRQASAGFPSGGSECILLVDDEPPIRDMATRTLSRFGYSVETACNGEEALSLYAGRQDRFDLVILDLGMPGMGGHKCLQEMLRINPLAKY
jgi:CheY-like chemotaxis protein